MRSILYLWIRSLKNALLELRKKPGVLILYILLAALIVGMFVLSRFTEPGEGAGADMEILKGIFFAFVTMYGIYGVKRGLASGGSFFDMSDVNFLFVSPLNPRVILIHGVARQIKLAFLAAFFVLFQAQNLKANFGMEASGVFHILIGFMLAAILSEILAMFIYSTTHGNPKRQWAVKIIAVLLFVPAAAQFVLSWSQTGNLYGAFVRTIDSWTCDGIPVLGWTAHGLMDMISGHMVSGLLFFGLTVLLGGGLVMAIALRSSDYYEDVLVATETGFEKRRAQLEGNLQAAGTRRKIRVAKTGLSGGGAGAIYGKHMRETLRENRLKIFSAMTLWTIIGAGVVALFMRDGGNSVIILQILMWMQMFFIGTGRGLKELYMHYIYLIPENAVAKMVWSNAEEVVKTLITATILFSVTGTIFREGPEIIVGCGLTYGLFTLTLLSINYLSMRVFKDTINHGLLVLFYVIGVLLIMLPGIVAAVVVGGALGRGLFSGLLVLSLWEIVAALICFQLSKGVLHNCDMPVVVGRK